MTAELLTYREAAERMGVHWRTVQTLVLKGDLGSVKVGTKLRRIRPADIDSYIEANRVEAAS